MNAIVPTKDTLAPEIISSLVIGGDLKGLTNEQRIAYYKYRCQQVGLDPSAKPFDLLTLNGKQVLYANAGCTQQLCQIHGLSPTLTDRSVVEGIYCVTSRVTGGGRTTENMGAVPVGGLKGDMLANAMMKAVTKAHRRTVLMHCGLGMLDETEVETIPGAQMPSFRNEAVNIVAEMESCGEADQLDAFFASADVKDWLVRADAAMVGKSGMSQGDYVRQMYHQIRDKLPAKKADKRAFIKSTDDYGDRPVAEAPASPSSHSAPEPNPLGDIGEKASAILDRIDVAESADMAAIAGDAKDAKDAGELTDGEAAMIQGAYRARARKVRVAA